MKFQRRISVCVWYSQSFGLRRSARGNKSKRGCGIGEKIIREARMRRPRHVVTKSRNYEDVVMRT